jgi:hypothetical protein
MIDKYQIFFCFQSLLKIIFGFRLKLNIITKEVKRQGI